MPSGLDKGELVELARRYFPGAPSEQSQNLLQAARDSALSIMDAKWEELRHRIRESLPQYRIENWTYLRLDPSYRLRVYTREAGDEATAVVACVSILAPVYIIYTSYQQQSGGLNLRPRTFYEPRPDTQHVESILESLIRSIFGFERLSNELLSTPVPDAVVGNLLPGEATLADCLFTYDRW